MSENILRNSGQSNEEIRVLVNVVEPVVDQKDTALNSELSNDVLDILSQSSHLSNRSLTPEKDENSILEENNNEHEGFEEIKNLQNEDNVKVNVPELVLCYDRESLIKEYKEITEERIKLQKSNNQYQHKLAEYFQKKKTDEQVDIERNENDQEQRYIKYISNLKELQSEEARQASHIQVQIEECKLRWEEKLKEVDEVSIVFNDLKYNIGKNSINSHSGKKIANADLEIYRLAETKKEQEVIACRLENIKLKNQLKKYEMELREKEELGEGLHLIDFEQLKIENQTYNEKIEDRNEELMKLRKKITSTVQIFSHIKEKLHFIQEENIELRQQLQDLDVTLAQRRDILTRTKQIRDSLRTDNNKLKHQAGLLGNETLLLDYEQSFDKSEQLRSRLVHLKDQHKELKLREVILRKESELMEIKNEVEDLSEYKILQQQQNSKINTLEKQVNELRIKHNESVQNLQSKFLEENIKFEKESKEELKRLTKEAKKEVHLCLHNHSMRIKRENCALRKELVDLIEKNSNLHQQKVKLEEEKKFLTREKETNAKMEGLKLARFNATAKLFEANY